MSEIDESRFIIGVVVKFKDVAVCLPRPNRHNDCFAYAASIGITNKKFVPENQGFYLADGTFLSRVEAAAHVKAVGQPLRDEVRRELFSEDLW